MTTPTGAARPRLLHPGLVGLGAGLLIAALATDYLYWQTLLFQWNNFSAWLLLAGLVVAGLAAVAFIADVVRRRLAGIAWLRFIGLAIAVLLSILNAFVHSRDAYTAVVPEGIMLSAIVALILVVVGVGGWSLETRRAFVPPHAGPKPMIRKLARRSFPLSLVLALAACDDQAADPSLQYGAHPKLPEPQQYLLPPMKVMSSRGWHEGEAPTVAAGLHIQALATGFEHPRVIYTLPNGDVLVVESNGPKAPVYRPKDFIEGKVKALAGSGAKAGQRVSLLREANGDGTVTQRTIFIDHLNSPYGIVLVGSDLYVADTDAILKFPYTAGETQITEPGTTLTDLPAQAPNHHWTKSLAASPDGSKLYVGVGSNSNITENGIGAEEGRAAIWEVDRATGLKRIYASGVRNPTNLAFEPTSRKLWAIANERDEIGPDLVPDYLTSVKENAFYGWPFSYYGQHVDVRVAPQNPTMVAKAIPPDYALGSHVAALGIAFSQGTSLPQAYRSGVFIGEHGSWDRDPPVGYKVVYIPFRDGHPDGMPQDVVTGFVSQDAHTRGRPVGVALDKTGALLVADDAGNTIWRVTAANATSASSHP